MERANFCGACGRALGADDRFCSGCGKAIEPGANLTKTATTITPQAPAPPPSKPFDPFQLIGPNNPVPPDSIWATTPYPGELPPEAFKGSVPKRIRAIGKLRGRPASEIISVLGPPTSISGMATGGKLRQWIKVSAYTGSYHYALTFDPYDLCIGITHQRG